MATISSERSARQDKNGRHFVRGKKIWHPSAPAAVIGSCRPRQQDEGWQTWRRHLATRARPRLPERLAQGPDSPLMWNLPADVEPVRQADLLMGCTPRGGGRGGSAEVWCERLTGWLEQLDRQPIDTPAALEAIWLAGHLSELADRLPAGLWWELLERLLALATDAGLLDLTSQPLLTQLLGGELPLVLAYSFPELKPCRKLGRVARQTLSAGIEELLDGEGLPHCRYYQQWRPLVACWTRCRAIGAHLKRRCWNQRTEDQYGWIVTQLIRFSRYDGSQVLSSGSPAAWSPGLLATALDLAGDAMDRAAAARSLPGLRKKRRSNKSRRSVELPEPAVHSDWSGLALLRPNWKRMGERLAVQYDGDTVRVELSSGRDSVLLGTWGYAIELAGTLLRPTGQWEEVCWESDEEMDYLELELTLQRGVRLQRQMAFAREDRCLYLADVILGPSVAEPIDYCGTLPFGPDVVFEGADESREGYLVGRKRRALVLPLALPEWRAASSPGELSSCDGALQLEMHAVGRNLCCPLLLDLNPRRLTRQRTWRQLTVAKKLQIQPAETAVGYRAQCGRDQWLFYRSLDAPTSRTVLGQELLCDFLMARFQPTGEVEEMIEVE